MFDLGTALGGNAAMPLNALIYVAVLGYVIRRQLITRPVTDRTLVLVALLFGYGLACGLPAHGWGLDALLVSLAMGAFFGVWRGASMRVWVDDVTGQLLRRGTALTLGLWATTVAIRLVMDAVVVAHTHTFELGGVWWAMAVTIGVQHLTVRHRARGRALLPATATPGPR